MQERGLGCRKCGDPQGKSNTYSKSRCRVSSIRHHAHKILSPNVNRPAVEIDGYN